jgi:hypothetical protein
MNKLITSAMIVFSVVLVSVAIVYAAGTSGYIYWPPGEEPGAVPGAGNVQLPWVDDGTNIYNITAGGVGIGVTNPQYTFQVQSLGRYYTLGADTAVAGFASSGFVLNTAQDISGGAVMGIDNDRKLWIGSGVDSLTNPTVQQDLILQVGDEGTGISGGKVGIGTTIPAGTLDIKDGQSNTDIKLSDGWSVIRGDGRMHIQAGVNSTGTDVNAGSLYLNPWDTAGDVIVGGGDTSVHNLIVPNGTVCDSNGCIGGGGGTLAITPGTWCGLRMSTHSGPVFSCNGYDPAVSCPSGYSSVLFAVMGDLGNWYTCVKS